MPYVIAAIDVHKKVVADVEVDEEYRFERRKVGTTPADLRALDDWLVKREVEEVVMGSTAQYWQPVWEALEQYWRPVRPQREGASAVSGTLHLAQAQSNRGAGVRKKDVRRLQDVHDAQSRVSPAAEAGLGELRLMEDHLGQLDHQMAQLLADHHDAVQRLAEVPGLGVDSVDGRLPGQ